MHLYRRRVYINFVLLAKGTFIKQASCLKSCLKANVATNVDVGTVARAVQLNDFPFGPQYRATCFLPPS